MLRMHPWLDDGSRSKTWILDSGGLNGENPPISAGAGFRPALTGPSRSMAGWIKRSNTLRALGGRQHEHPETHTTPFSSPEEPPLAYRLGAATPSATSKNAFTSPNARASG